MRQDLPKFTQFVDLVLLRLWESEQPGADDLFDLYAIAAQVNDAIPTAWVIDAAKVLENRGWAEVILTFAGCVARLTGEGRLYVESEKGITGEAKREPERFFVNVSGTGHQVAVGQANHATQHGNSNAASPTDQLLTQMRTAVQSDATLSGEEKADVDAYLDVVDREVRKRQPNRTILAAVLEPLSRITSIASQVATVIKVVNG